MGTFIDPSAHFDGESLGEGSRVLAFARVSAEAVIGRDCVLHEHVTVAGPVVLEDGVEVKHGAYVAGRTQVEKGAKIGPRAVVGEEVSGESEPASPTNVIRPFASIGASATVVPGIEVGRGAVVEAGSVVTQNVPANAVVSGNPARIITYVDAGPEYSGDIVAPTPAGPDRTDTRVWGVTLHRLTLARDLRGSLAAAEYSMLPFMPKRIFVVYDVPNESVRGTHAHRVCSQFLVCLSGSLSCLVDDGIAREEIRLESPNVGLTIPPMIWATQWKYTRDAVLLVMASHPYDPDDYIRGYEEFLELRGKA